MILFITQAPMKNIFATFVYSLGFWGILGLSNANVKFIFQRRKEEQLPAKRLAFVCTICQCFHFIGSTDVLQLPAVVIYSPS